MSDQTADCGACKQFLIDRISESERRQTDAISRLRERVNAHDILIGDESRRTGLFGAVSRTSDEIKDVGKTVKEIRDIVLQAKGVGFAARALWAFIGAGGAWFVIQLLKMVVK